MLVVADRGEALLVSCADGADAWEAPAFLPLGSRFEVGVDGLAFWRFEDQAEVMGETAETVRAIQRQSGRPLALQPQSNQEHSRRKPLSNEEKNSLGSYDEALLDPATLAIKAVSRGGFGMLGDYPTNQRRPAHKDRRVVGAFFGATSLVDPARLSAQRSPLPWPERAWMISPRMEIAISAGVSAPISRPTGP